MDSRTEPADSVSASASSTSASASESAPEPESADAAPAASRRARPVAWVHARAPRQGRPDLRDSAARPPLVRELLLVVGLLLVYKVGRQLATGHTAEAFANAHRVWGAERTLRLPGESAVQTALLHSDTLVRLANTYYATVHFPATAAFLIWLYLRRPVHYMWARRVLALVTAAALAGHLIFPLAPPRLLAESGLPAHTGLAMGLGLDRLLMLRKGIDDTRLLRATDPRIASQLCDLEPYRPVSMMPPVRRDLSIVVGAPRDAEALGDQVRNALGARADLVEAVEILSTTPCAALPPAAIARLGIAPGQHNVLVRVTLRALDRTLTHDECNVLRDDIYAALHEGGVHHYASRSICVTHAR